MDRDTTQVDLEHGAIPPLQIPSLSATGRLCRSTSPIAGSFSLSPQVSDSATAIEEKFFLEGQAPTNDQQMDYLHRQEPSPKGQAKSGPPKRDPPEKILGLYLSEAEKSDKENSESWRANTDGVLVFTGVFSATVAAFIIVSYQSLQPDSADSTVRLLTQISQQLTALSNGTPLPIPLTLPDAASFKPTPSAVRVNALWFVSLSLSTACALWATLMQQWARRYVQIADRPFVSTEHARIRAYFADGVEMFKLATAVEVLPVLLHLSVLLFYVGLVDFLLNINITVGVTLLVPVALSILAYFVLSVMPLFYYNSPYLTPLSMVIWFVLEAASLIKLRFVNLHTPVQARIQKQRDTIMGGMDKALEDTCAERPWELDSKALHRTLLSLDDDHKMQDFLDGVPDLLSSTAYPSKMRDTLEPHVARVTHRLITTSPTDLHESVRRQRITACLDAIWYFPKTMERHLKVVWDQWIHGKANEPWGLLSSERWKKATKMTANSDPVTALRAYRVQALIAVMRLHGEWKHHKSEWATQLQSQLGTSADVIARHLDLEGNHLQLAIAANLLTKALPLLRKIKDKDGAIKKDVKVILDSICKELDVSDVPEDLQIRFVDRTKVSEVFSPELRAGGARQTSIVMMGPWTKVFAPDTTSNTDDAGGTYSTGRTLRAPL